MFQYIIKLWYNKTIKLKTKKMSKKQEIFEAIESHYNDFVENHNGTTKASQTRARKSIGEIKKLVTDYRKSSVEEQG